MNMTSDPLPERSWERERIRFLQSEINSHFLYNTLESLRGMLLLGDIPACRRTLTDIAGLCRYSADRNVMVTVAEEIGNAEQYFSLITRIMPTEVRFVTETEKGMETREIPRMLIQPLLENAYLHGFYKCGLKEGTIRLKIFLDGSELALSMANDGAGIPAGLIMTLNELPTENRGKHIGLANITERIRLLYPETGFVEIRSDGSHGAETTIHF